jgi:hypothetical protein
MKIEGTAEEVWALVEKMGGSMVANELSKRELEAFKKQAENAANVNVMPQAEQDLTQENGKEKQIVIPVDKLAKVLVNLDNMDEVRLVALSLQKMLPEDTKAEMVKWITDATPERVNRKELVRMQIAEAGDILTGDSSKIVNLNQQRKEA